MQLVIVRSILLQKGELEAEIIEGEWVDAGTFESLHRASQIVREHHQKESSKLSIEVHEVKKGMGV